MRSSLRIAAQRWLLLLVCFCGGVCAAQTPWTRAFLWEASQGDKKLYLLGGMAVGKREFYPMPTSVGNAIRAADTVVVESDSSDIDPGAKLGAYPEGDTLEAHIAPDLFSALSNTALNYDIPEQYLNGMRPWLVYFSIIFREFASAGYSPDLSTETLVTTLARELNKPISSLGTASEAVRYLDDMPAPLNDALLRGLLRELKDGSAVPSLDNLWAAMRAGDEAQFLASAEQAERMYPKIEQLRDYLFFSRHPDILRKLEQYLASGKTHFVVLGAVNLMGPQGLLEALKRKGYQVTPL